MAGKWIWEPTPESIKDTNAYGMMARLGIPTVEEFVRFSQDSLEEFWELMVRESGIEWFRPYTSVLDTSAGPEWARWFVGGKLNIAWNCLDRHALGKAADRIACLAEREDGHTRSITFRELYGEVNRVANGLLALGVNKGDRVALCIPMISEAVVVLYACFKIGAIAVPIFSGFGTSAIASRLQDSGARVLFTADQVERRGVLWPLKEKVDQALDKGSAVEKVIVCRYHGRSLSWNAGRDLWWEELIADQQAHCASLPLNSEDEALILYTSGTTGRPKGAVHSHAGALAQTTKEIYLAFDHKDSDRFFWLSDIGWMMGPWEIIGNHNFGGTIFLYDGAPDFPQPDRLWSMVERHRITTLGVSPTAIRLLMRRDPEGASKHDTSSLRILGSTGEPWDETSYRWYFENVGRRRCPVINISGGTEIIGCFLFPLPLQPLKACTLGGPAPGMATDVFDDAGQPVRGNTGYLVCTKPAPSMTRGIWGDPKRYLETYWSRWKGVWNHGDWARVDEDGYWFLHGRSDESMNVAGRKVGPAEVEDALMEHPAVSEAAVIGVPDELKGEAIVAFVVPKTGVAAEGLAEQLPLHLAQALGPTFRPQAVQIVEALPKTQSGKVVRRLIRQRYMGEPLGDLSTVENPGVLESFKTAAGEGSGGI